MGGQFSQRLVGNESLPDATQVELHAFSLEKYRLLAAVQLEQSEAGSLSSNFNLLGSRGNCSTSCPPPQAN